jgi:single-stranded-DNA-specific exonuclease
MRYKWEIAQTDNKFIEYAGSFFKQYPYEILKIINAKGINSLEQIDLYLNSRTISLNSPYLMDGMYDAVNKIKEIISKPGKIGVFADSDLDGISSLAIMNFIFLKLGSPIVYRLPVSNESYGLSKDVIDEFIQKKIDLLITVDSGIRDIDEIAYAKEHGIETIIIDHHEQGEELPDAVILNPKKKTCLYPNKNLAGVGVAFKLVHALCLSYIASFNKSFILISKSDAISDSLSYKSSDNLYDTAYIKNLIVEKKQHALNIEEIKTYIKDNPACVVVDTELFNLLNLIEYQKHHVKDIINFTNIETLLKSANIKSLLEAFDVYKIPKFLSNIDKLLYVFFEIQNIFSPKINDLLHELSMYFALGTIADLVNLTDENRTIAKYGIESLSKKKHAGLSMIIADSKVDCKFVAWNIAPILNTPGRFGRPLMTVEFLLNSNSENINKVDKINELFLTIKQLNEKRKTIVSEECERLLNNIKNNIYNNIENDIIINDKIIVLISRINEDGLTGLIANKIIDKLLKPVVVAVKTDSEFVRGSGRSPDGINFLEALSPYMSNFEKIGGHSQAFGFTLKHSLIKEVFSRINEDLNNKKDLPVVKTIDLELNLSDITLEFIKSLSLLEPFGRGNDLPIFIVKNAAPSEFIPLGEKNHGKYLFSENRNLSAVGWSMASEMKDHFDKKNKIDIVFELEINEFRDMCSPQMKILDIISC